MLIKIIIKYIIAAYKKIVYGVLYLAQKHTFGFLFSIIAFVLALLSVHHCKYGLFFGCKDYVYNNTFTKPCTINQTINCQRLVVAQKEIKQKPVEEKTKRKKFIFC